MNSSSTKLRRKQAFYIISGQLLTIILFTGAIIWNTNNGLNEMQANVFEQRSHAIATVAAELLEHHESSESRVSEVIAQHAGNALINLKGTDGTTLWTYQSDQFVNRADNQTYALELINESGQLIGSLQANFAPYSLKVWLLETLWIFIATMIICLIITPWTVNKLDQMTTKRIRSIARLTDSISSNSDFKKRIEEKGDDDISQLCKNINYMLEAVEGREAQLTSYGAYLEALVKEKSNQLQAQVNIDAMTLCPNRLTLMAEGDRIITQALEEGLISALIVVDLLRLKTYNQSLGHQAGDYIIRQVAASLRNHYDEVYRIGGDEFAIVIQHAHLNTLINAAEQALMIVRQPFEYNGQMIQIDVAAGMSLAPDHGMEIATLLRCANAAMQHAKQSSAFSVTEYNPELTSVKTRQFEIEHDLPEAIEKDDLYLVYQPKFNLKTKTIEGVEALARWHHPKLGAISPVEFVSIAEESGQARALGLCVLKQAVKQLHDWLQDDIQLSIAVNISPAQIMHPYFVNDILGAINSYEIDPTLLELEITESLLVEDQSYISESIDELRSLGISIAIDDFGTGYSSLSYIRKFNIDTLKLDASFISDLESSSESTGIVDAVVLLAHTIGMKVVAEGVESKGQEFVLSTLGCDYIQGSLISMPITSEQVEALAITTNTKARRLVDA